MIKTLHLMREIDQIEDGKLSFVVVFFDKKKQKDEQDLSLIPLSHFSLFLYIVEIFHLSHILLFISSYNEVYFIFMIKKKER